MGLATVWKNYRVLIVMIPSVGFVHWGWYKMQSDPTFNPEGQTKVPLILRILTGKGTDTKDN